MWSTRSATKRAAQSQDAWSARLTRSVHFQDTADQHTEGLMMAAVSTTSSPRVLNHWPAFALGGRASTIQPFDYDEVSLVAICSSSLASIGLSVSASQSFLCLPYHGSHPSESGKNFEKVSHRPPMVETATKMANSSVPRVCCSHESISGRFIADFSQNTDDPKPQV